MDWATNRSGSSEGIALLTTKLHVARTQPNVVCRKRLLDRLDDGLRRRLTLVTAPVGFGKTTLLADWAGSDHRVVAWLSLDASDDDPRRFWQYVIGALRQAQPGLGAATADALERGEAIEFALTPLLNELSGMSGHIVLILDDFHCIHHQRILAAVDFLLERMPPQAHVFISGRTTPPLQLARLRARGELAELRESELRFTELEAAELMRATAGPSIADADMAEVVRLAEGWGVGLQLAALSIGEQPDASSVRADVNQRYRYVSEYVFGEIIDGLEPDSRDFLMRMSLLECFSAPMASVLMGQAHHEFLPFAAKLERLADDHFFVIPVPGEIGWFRLHRLFRTLLAERYGARSTQSALELHRRAAEWLEDNGLTRHSVDHCIALGDMDAAARLAERCAEELLATRMLEPLIAWQAQLPARTIAARPRLALAFSWALLLAGQGERARGFAAVARSSSPIPSRDGLSDISGHLAAIESALDQIETPKGRATGTEGRGPASRAVSEVGTGDVRAKPPEHHEESEEDERLASEQDVGPIHRSPRFSVPEALPEIARMQLRQGRLVAAAATFSEALDMLADERDDDPLVARTAAACHVGLATIEYERNNLDAAMRHVSDGITHARTAADAGAVGQGYALLGQIHEARGDHDGALDALADAERLLRTYGASDVDRAPVTFARAMLALARGEADEAAALVRVAVPLGDAGRRELLQARISVALRRPEDAIAGASRVLERAEAAGEHDLATRALLIQSLALDQLGESEQAAQSAQRGLLLCEIEGYLRTILDEREAMTRLLKKMRAMQENGELAGPSPSRDFIRNLLAGFGVHGRPAHANGHANGLGDGLLTPISDREIEVLHLIADGKSNASIADALYISVSTVKTHINNLYSKLGVESRTQALARAKEYNLI